MLYNAKELKSNFDTKESRFSGYKKVILDVYAENQQAEDMLDDINEPIMK